MLISKRIYGCFFWWTICVSCLCVWLHYRLREGVWILAQNLAIRLSHSLVSLPLPPNSFSDVLLCESRIPTEHPNAPSIYISLLFGGICLTDIECNYALYIFYFPFRLKWTSFNDLLYRPSTAALWRQGYMTGWEGRVGEMELKKRKGRLAIPKASSCLQLRMDEI